MNRIQKQSWIMVISTGIAFFISCIVVACRASAKGFPAAWYIIAYGKDNKLSEGGIQ